MVQRALARQTYYYGETDTWLYAALDRYPIEGKRVLIIGRSGSQGSQADTQAGRLAGRQAAGRRWAPVEHLACSSSQACLLH